MISALIEFLAICYQQGDANGVAMAAQTILSVIPDDVVALQFMALALLQMGQKDKAIPLLREAASLSETNTQSHVSEVCELAATISYREATKPESGLGDGWSKISVVLERYGLNRLAEHARQASLASQAVEGCGIHPATHAPYKSEAALPH